MMEIINALEIPDMENAHGVSAKPLHSTEHVQVVMITLEPGEALKLHLTPVDAFFYVLEGAGVVEIGGEQETSTRISSSPAPRKFPIACGTKATRPSAS